MVTICHPARAMPESVLRYVKPAQSWEEEALPLGNGRLGAMALGDVTESRFQLNVDSLWTGDENPSGDYESMGEYRTLGDLFLCAPAAGPVTEYRRSLDLRTGVHAVQWTRNGAVHTQHAFISAPDQVMVVRWSTTVPGRVSGRVRLRDGQNNTFARAEPAALAYEGRLSNGLQYAARVEVSLEGGRFVPAGPDEIAFKDCTSVVLRLAAATDYAMDRAQGWRSGTSPKEANETVLAAARSRSFADLLNRHTRDHAAIFDRCVLDLGATPADVQSLPIDERIKRYARSPDDRGLEALLFAYGRYLLMDSSRPGTLPANLQGIWNESNHPPWHCDYHSNINLQMNYWAAESTGLADMHGPLFDYLDAMAPAYREASQKQFKTSRGWTIRTSHNITGGQGWEWNIPGSAWYARHYYEHAVHSADASFAKDRAYPVLREMCDFWAEHLKALPDGTLVAPDGWSPEHGPREDGVSHDQQIIWDLFQNYIEISRWMGGDAGHRARIAELQSRLADPRIGKWGQLMEWMTDRDDPNDRHRHTSHLYAVYPGRQISTAGTPDLARAAAVSLEARGTTDDSRRSWTWPWRTALWARLGNAGKAHEMIQGLIKYNLMANAITTHKPLQLDGNFGYPAGVCEMLMQSHAVLAGADPRNNERPDFVIDLLPAIPKAWPDGAIRGLRARGGYTVSITWRGGQLHQAVISSPRDAVIPVRYRGTLIQLSVKKGIPARVTRANFREGPNQ